jgi:hypothetical protein
MRGNDKVAPIPAVRRAKWISCLATRELTEQDFAAPGVSLGRRADC